MIDHGKRSRILAVDEEPAILHLIADVLGKDETLDVRCSRDLREGRSIASQIKPDLIVCGPRDLAEWARFRAEEQADDEVVPPLLLLLCDGTDLDAVTEGLGRGADDYLGKGLCQFLLASRVRSMVDARRLHEELRAGEERLSQTHMLLEKNFQELSSILLKIIEVRVPGASDRAKDAKAIARFIAERLGLPGEKRRQLTFAALMHEIGKVGLPDTLTGKHYNGLPADLKLAYRQHATIGSMIIATMTGYRESAEAVHHQLENYDGSGFPDELMGDEIPVEARILRAVTFQEELSAEGCPTGIVVERVRVAMHSILEQRIANLLIEYLSAHDTKPETNKLKLRVDELKAGMIIAEDVYAASGVKLLPKGVQLNDKTLSLLVERNETDPIIGGVYILTDWSLLYGT